ncbi:MAG TPA: protein kinase [Gemmataceae bacterium]
MPHADPSLSIAQRVDAACDRFEAEWKAGHRPRVEDYLAAAPQSDREPLRQALTGLLLELQGRGAADTSASGSSVRSGDKPPIPTAAYIDMSAEMPTAVGRFEIRSVLGSGAFGKVYRAFDPQLGREVALKVPLQESVKTEADRRQFLKEARSAATINHPNVCQIHEVGEHGGRPYIVMALVPGQSLADLIQSKKKPLPGKQSALIVRKIALALAAAHGKGIVHRDLKPANVMFDKERKDIVVMDFGLARGPKVTDARATQSGVIMGTPAYMSPEQARGDSKAVGPAGDIFSLGVILYELLTGTKPFQGTALEVIGQIVHLEPEPPSKRRPGIDPRLEAICQKAMAKDPAARFASMKEFAAAIDAVLRTPTAAGASAETARPEKTRQGAEQPGTETLGEVFAAFSVERKQARAETAEVVEAAIARYRTPRWVLVLAGLLLVGGMAALGGIVFFTRSDKVKVTIELTDVDLSDKSLSFFLDEEPISAEVLASPIELSPGEHVLVVKRGNELVKRMLFTVKGGGSPGIKVRDITPTSPPNKELTPEQEDRKLAEWLVSIGVSVGLSIDDGPERRVGKHVDTRSLPQRLADLPKEPFRVTSFDSWGNKKVTDRTVEPILRWIERRKIEFVSFFGNPIGDETVRRLVKPPSLKKIYLGATKVTPACIQILATRTDLVALNIQEMPIGDKALEKLHGLVNLESLSLDRTKVTDAGLKHLRDMKKLRDLALYFTAVTGAGLEELAGLPIERMGLNYTKVRGAEGLARLKKLPELKHVDLWGLLLSDADLKPLIECKSIEHLEIMDNRITDAGLDELAKMKWLRNLQISLGTLSNPVTPAGVERLRKALPNCNVIYEAPPDEDRESASQKKTKAPGKP